MTLQDTGTTDLEAVLPAQPKTRDALGQFCFLLHFVPLIYVVTGWLAPWREALMFYLLFLPGMYLQWRLNRDSCVLNNVESLIRTGRWRNPRNREEGAWLRTLVNDRVGWNISRRRMDALVSSAILLFWLVALMKLLRWF